MNIYEEIDLQDCPLCGGAALLQEEQGWCFYITCVDCDCHTVEVPFKGDEQKIEAAKSAAHLWNIGKVIIGDPNR